MASKQVAEIELPDKVNASVSDSTLSVTGPEGSSSRAFPSDRISMSVEKGRLVLKPLSGKKEVRRVIGSFKAHASNMVKGALSGHHYRLKICSGHFPMNVSVSGREFVVKNIFGEKTPRKLVLREGVSVKVSGSDIDVKSADKELAGMAAASIEQLTKRRAFDRRRFQDGIYIVSSD